MILPRQEETNPSSLLIIGSIALVVNYQYFFSKGKKTLTAGSLGEQNTEKETLSKDIIKKLNKEKNFNIHPPLENPAHFISKLFCLILNRWPQSYSEYL